MKKLLLSALSVLTCSIATNSLSAQSELLFKSSFDGITVDYSNTNKPILTGTDTETNFTFPDDLPGNNDRNYFNFVIDEDDDYEDFVNAYVRDTEGPNADDVNALYMEFIKDDPDQGSTSRVQYVIHGDESSDDPVQRMNKGYVKYYMKMEFDRKNPRKDWSLPIEWKDTNDDGFRLGLYVYDSDTDEPYWLAKGQYMIDGSLGDDVWEFESDEPVKIDEWFKLEVFWLADPDEDTGKFRVALDDKIIFDITDQTKDEDQPEKMYYFMPFKVYGTKGESYVTDFEYRDIAPQGSVLYTGLSNGTAKDLSNEGIYPIPTNDFLNFSNAYSNLEYQITTTSGAVVKAGVNNTNKVDVSALANGMYFIQFKGETNTATKFIKN